MLLISKRQLIPTDANIAMVLICKLFQSRLQIGQFERSFPDIAHIKAIAVFITWQKPCSGKYVVGNPSNINFTSESCDVPGWWNRIRLR